jgi:sugar (pentulose or hexulose) kinase
MVAPLVLTLDAGTGSLRALVYDLDQGITRAVVSREISITHPEPDRAEFDPSGWAGACLEAIKDAVAQVGQPATAYRGITATSLRQGFVLLDAAGATLGPGILNYDRRGAEGIARIARHIDTEDLYQLTGHWPAPELTLPKLLWFQQEAETIWKDTHTILFIHDWLLYLLTGELGTNATLACAGQMADVRQRAWATDLIQDFGIRDKKLPVIHPSGYHLGGLKPELARYTGLLQGTPVYVGGGDTQFGSLGAGGMQADTVVIVGGSTTPLMLTTQTPIFDAKRFPWVSTHLHEDLWALEMIAGHTGMIYQWIRELCRSFPVSMQEDINKISYDQLNQLARESTIGTRGLRVLASSPRWAQDTWERRAPYVIYNFSVAHNLGDLARAILESVCFAVRGNLEILERVAEKPAKRVIYTGGATRSPFWTQMMADVLGRDILIPHDQESAARAGAQVVSWAGQDNGSFDSPAMRPLQPDQEASNLYHEHYQDYLDIFERLHATFA